MAQIKRIQLRGISRTPSDRMTEDGGCAESLNAYLDSGEIAPIHDPVSCHEEFGLEEDIKAFEPIYIHKTNTYENLITFYRSNGILAYVVNGEHIPIIESTGLFINKVTHIGNTLIVSTDKKVYYLLFHNNEYKVIDLSEENLPKLSFVNIKQKSGAMEGASSDIWSWQDYSEEYHYDINGNPERDYLVEDEDAQEALTRIWNTYRRMIDNNLERGCFSETIMLRYAIRLYDGSYIWASSPIMLGSILPKDKVSLPFDNMDRGNTMPMNAYTVWVTGDKVDDTQYRTIVQLSTPYKIGVNAFRHSDLSHLKDIVSSVDVFLSSPVNYFPEGYKRVRSYMEKTSDDYYNSCRRYVFDPAFSEDKEKIEEAVLSASTFFLIKSYEIDDLPTTTDILSDNYLGESLFTKTRLDDNKVMSLVANATNFGSYNDRLLAIGVDELISRGIGVLNGQYANAFVSEEDYVLDNVSYAFAYHIPEKNLIIRDVDAKSDDGSYKMVPDVGKGGMDFNEVTDVLSTPYAWISHPDPNCTKVTIRIYNGGILVSGYELPMKPHPFLPCSYAFLGIGEKVFVANKIGEGNIDDYRDKPIVRQPNKVAISSSANPFAFALSGKLTFGEDVYGFAVATEPMSVGQFGQYPIYFFCKDGVWTTTITPDGNFGSAPTLVTRDVCSSPSTICPSKNSVFFMSKRGLLAISGSQVANISEYMNGDSYNVPEHLIPIIESVNFVGLVKEDDGPIASFPNYMNLPDTKVVYDYEGERLVCFNNNYDYQYVYCLKTQTWHRTQYGYLDVALNSYPRCMVVTRKSKRTGSIYVDHHAILDISLTKDLTLTPKKILIVTRPFDLQEPDVLKTITDVRVRGNFAKGAFNFFLQGSQDGINFHTISTLRGKSWKLFRIILLANLALNERISWIDVMYDSRFTNRLR